MIPQQQLDDLALRLDLTRWPDELPGVGWQYGVPCDYLRDLVAYWRHEYDWRAAEARLNEWPQFTTTIDGTRIHFARVPSPEPESVPLLITHGWPGSIAEFVDVAGPLTDPRAHGATGAPAFELVIPSIPGFGLSGPTSEPGWEVSRIARAFAELMDRLGHQRYGVQGGDWGAAISRELGRITSGGTDGRPRPEANKSANISAGNNRDRCSAKKANTLPAANRCPATASTSSSSRCRPASPCIPQRFQAQQISAPRHADYSAVS